MRNLIPMWVLMIFVISIWYDIALAQENELFINLDELIREAIEKNPEIQAAERGWQATLQIPRQVSTLPDPTLSYSQFGSSVETRVGPQENVFTLSQKIPFPGKLGLKGKMASQVALADEQKYEATKRDVIFKVKSSYYDLYWIDQSLEILSQYLVLLKDFTSVAERKYATGQGIQANVLKSQVEISSILERRLAFEKIRQGAVARINALLDRPRGMILDKVSEIDPMRVELDETDLIGHALSEREELLASQAMIDRSKYMRSLAKREYLPDFNLEARYISVSEGMVTAMDAGEDAWSVMVGINIPIWLNKRNAAVREANETLLSNKLTYQNLQNQVESEIDDLYFRLQITGETLDLYEQGLLTQAESSLESSMASYGTGRLDFLNLLDAERMLLNLKLGYVKEQSNYQKQLAALERAAGGTLPE